MKIPGINRRLNVWENAVLKLEQCWAFTLPGNPLIYNGQEVGITKKIKFFERDPIEWQENEFRLFYQTLATTFRNRPALYRGEMIKFESEENNQIYVFARKYQNDMVIVIVNFSPKSFSGHINFKTANNLLSRLKSNSELIRYPKLDQKAVLYRKICTINRNLLNQSQIIADLIENRQIEKAHGKRE